MAIKIKSQPDRNELRHEFPDAYLKVESVEIRTHGPEDQKVWISFLVYASETARKAEAFSVDKRRIMVRFADLEPHVKSFSSDGLKSAAYLYLKGLPEFAKGEDA